MSINLIREDNDNPIYDFHEENNNVNDEINNEKNDNDYSEHILIETPTKGCYENIFMFRYMRAFDKKFPYVTPILYWCTLSTFEIIFISLLISNAAVSTTRLNPIIIAAGIFGFLIVLFFWKSQLNVMNYIANWEARGYTNYMISFAIQSIHIGILLSFLLFLNLGGSDEYDPFSSVTCDTMLSAILLLSIVNMLLCIQSTLFPWYGNIYSKNNCPLGEYPEETRPLNLPSSDPSIIERFVNDKENYHHNLDLDDGQNYETILTITIFANMCLMDLFFASGHDQVNYNLFKTIFGIFAFTAIVSTLFLIFTLIYTRKRKYWSCSLLFYLWVFYGVQFAANTIKTGVFFGIYMHDTNTSWPYTFTRGYLIYSTILFFIFVIGTIIPFLVWVIRLFSKASFRTNIVDNIKKLNSELCKQALETDPLLTREE
jgi:hypothetical protein